MPSLASHWQPRHLVAASIPPSTIREFSRTLLFCIPNNASLRSRVDESTASKVFVELVDDGHFAFFFANGKLPAKDRYAEDEVWIEDAVRLDDGKIKITFSTMPESLYYCPGAVGEIKKNWIDITFVRAGIRRRPKVTYPVQRVSDPGKVSKFIVIDSGGKPVFVKTEGKRLQVFPRIAWREFSSATLRQLRKHDQPVLVFCGAAWDSTCEFAKLSAFSKESVANAIREQAYVSLRADFTKPSEDIRALMREVGATYGEMAVVLFRPDRGKPIVLQQVTTLEKDLLDAINSVSE